MTWLATPPAERPKDLQTYKQFCAAYRVSLPELAGFESEAGFIDAITECRVPWVKRLHRLIEAAFVNAENPNHKDQLEWMKLAVRIAREGPKSVLKPGAGGEADEFRLT